MGDPMKGYKILIVEDDQKMNQGLVHILSKEGYVVESVDSGEKILEQERKICIGLRNVSVDTVVKMLKERKNDK